MQKILLSLLTAAVVALSAAVIAAPAALASSCSYGGGAYASGAHGGGGACGVTYRRHTYTTCVPRQRQVCNDRVVERRDCVRQDMQYPIDACPSGGCGQCNNGRCGNVRQYIPYSVCTPTVRHETVRECHTETVCVPEQRCVMLPHCVGGDCGSACNGGACAPRSCGAGYVGAAAAPHGGHGGGSYHSFGRRALTTLPVAPAHIPGWLRRVR